MCGITGYWDRAMTQAEAALNHIGTGMLRAIEHRGPDDEGVWADAATGIVLGSRFAGTNLSKANLIGATNYDIDVTNNNVKQAKFALPEAIALLHSLGITLEGST